MFGIDDAIMGALGSIGGSAIGGLAGYFGQQQTNRENVKLARDQMDWQARQNTRAMDFSADQAFRNRAWQEDMSNTAWRRGIADMRAAGINPMLAFSKGGQSASTPSGSSASGVSGSGSQARVENPFANVGSAINNALSLNMRMEELKNLRTANDKLKSDIYLNKQNAATAKSLAGLYDNRSTNEGLQTPGLRNMADAQNTVLGKAAPYFSIGGGIAGDVIGSISPLKGFGSWFRRTPGTPVYYNRK